MATFRKRGPYQWQAQVRKRGYPPQTNTFETRAAAEKWARTIEHEISQGIFIPRTAAESTTLLELLERYLKEITPSKKSADSETARIGAFMSHPLATRIVASIRGADIARYRDERLTQVSPSTVKRDLVILSHLFEIARKEWAIHTPNPVREIKLPPSAKPRNRRLQSGINCVDNEEKQLLQACKQSRNPYLVPVVILALETAMRQSELVNLQWEHVNLDRRVAHLPDTKNGEARTVPLSTVAIEILRTLPPSGNTNVFYDLTTEAIKQAFTRATRRAKLDNLRFHDLRHEATTRLFERGLNIMEVASITGHKDLRMLRRYTHLKAEDLAKKLA